MLILELMSTTHQSIDIKRISFDKDTLVILISQSGETADTLAAMKLANEHDIDTLSIVNRRDSSIARESKYVIYTPAGIEIAVATTKAYLAQVIILILLAIRIVVWKKKE